MTLFFGPVAQWLAQATHNRLVDGSTPSGPTFDAISNARLMFQKVQFIYTGLSLFCISCFNESFSFLFAFPRNACISQGYYLFLIIRV
jgi:hypothetical protein